MTRHCTRFVFALLVAAPFALAQRGTLIEQQLTFAPYHASGIYDVGETIGWTVTPGTVTPTYSYKWTIRRNNAIVIKEGKLDLSSGSGKIEITGDEPEMIYVAVEPDSKLATDAAAQAPPAGTAAASPSTESAYVGGNTGRNNGLYAVGSAVAPQKLGLSTPRPADFDAFWDGKLAAQAEVPINAELTPVETGVPGVELNMFVMDALGSKAHGYLAKPAREGKFPALIQLQYAGVYALNAHGPAQRAAEGWLVLNVDSHDKLPSDASGNIPAPTKPLATPIARSRTSSICTSATRAFSITCSPTPIGTARPLCSPAAAWAASRVSYSPASGPRRSPPYWSASPRAPMRMAICTAAKPVIPIGLPAIRT
jgi:cephalosporin-C deacetylase